MQPVCQSANVSCRYPPSPSHAHEALRTRTQSHANQLPPRARQYTFTDKSRMVSYAEYNNDASAVDFTLDNDEVVVTDEGFLELRLTKDNGGPRVSTTRPIHYGRITARMRTSRWQGVVTAFVSGAGFVGVCARSGRVGGEADENLRAGRSR